MTAPCGASNKELCVWPPWTIPLENKILGAYARPLTLKLSRLPTIRLIGLRNATRNLCVFLARLPLQGWTETTPPRPLISLTAPEWTNRILLFGYFYLNFYDRLRTQWFIKAWLLICPIIPKQALRIPTVLLTTFLHNLP